MTSTQATIVSSYEQSLISPEDIAESLELDVAAVKATLLQFSSKYRETIKDPHLPEKEDITQEEYDEILAAYKQLALGTENEFLKERALRNLINERKGRNDPKSKEAAVKSGGTINIFEFNKYLIEARTKALQNAIDVGVVEVKQIG